MIRERNGIEECTKPFWAEFMMSSCVVHRGTVNGVSGIVSEAPRIRGAQEINKRTICAASKPIQRPIVGPRLRVFDTTYIAAPMPARILVSKER